MKTQKLNFTNLKNSKVVNNIFKSVLGLSLIATLASCVEGGDMDVEAPQPDGIALNDRFQNNRIDALQEFTLDAAAGGTITGLQGTNVTFLPNSFGLNGSPVTGNVTLELPVIEDKAGIMVGARGAYAGWILRSLDEEQLKNSEASFYDVILKYNHEISEKDDFKASAYYSRDRFSITSDSIYGYSNRLFSAGWQHEINSKHNYQVTLSNSEYKFDIEYDGDFTNDFDLNYKNTETELKLKFNYLHDDEKRFNYGLSAKLYGIEPGEVNPLGPESIVEAKR